MSDDWDDRADALAGDMADLKAEIKRLRALFQGILDNKFRDQGFMVGYAVQQAHRALDGEKE